MSQHLGWRRGNILGSPELHRICKRRHSCFRHTLQLFGASPPPGDCNADGWALRFDCGPFGSTPIKNSRPHAKKKAPTTRELLVHHTTHPSLFRWILAAEAFVGCGCLPQVVTECKQRHSGNLFMQKKHKNRVSLRPWPRDEVFTWALGSSSSNPRSTVSGFPSRLRAWPVETRAGNIVLCYHAVGKFR